MMGRYPIGTIGFGIDSEYSRSRMPNPPQNKTTFMYSSLVGWPMVQTFTARFPKRSNTFWAAFSPLMNDSSVQM
jgi:hypothetical protein